MFGMTNFDMIANYILIAALVIGCVGFKILRKRHHERLLIEENRAAIELDREKDEIAKKEKELDDFFSTAVNDEYKDE